MTFLCIYGIFYTTARNDKTNFHSGIDLLRLRSNSRIDFGGDSLSIWRWPIIHRKSHRQ
eukprot:COSAG06_NODE_20887_length_775_cov_2.474926_1_plen_58_part_10